MEYIQERVATLHDYGEADPAVPLGRAAIVVPMTTRDYATETAADIFSTLAGLDPGKVVVPLRAPKADVEDVIEWISAFELQTDVLWCNAPAVDRQLAEASLDGPGGKGRDVWLALGVASSSDYVVIHDADATSYDGSIVPKLLFPLTRGYDFSKGYYARVENAKLYGRLFRLFVRPLLVALGRQTSHEFLQYLTSFRYALAGECAMTGDLARQIRAPRGWGLELGMLGDAYEWAGFDETAQVDLGIHTHDHRPVTGESGLGSMSEEVANTLFTTLEAVGIEPDYGELREQYRKAGETLVSQYATDAAFNDFEFDRDSELAQVNTYEESIEPPGPDDRLPAWSDCPLDPTAVWETSRDALGRGRHTIEADGDD